MYIYIYIYGITIVITIVSITSVVIAIAGWSGTVSRRTRYSIVNTITDSLPGGGL